MTRTDLIKKWKKELEMYKRILKDSLMYTKEERAKAASKSLVIVSMLVDVDELKTLD